jgi:hypothetical protein
MTVAKEQLRETTNAYLFPAEKLNLAISKTIDSIMNREVAFSLLKQITDTHALVQAMSYTRG